MEIMVVRLNVEERSRRERKQKEERQMVATVDCSRLRAGEEQGKASIVSNWGLLGAVGFEALPDNVWVWDMLSWFRLSKKKGSRGRRKEK